MNFTTLSSIIKNTTFSSVLQNTSQSSDIIYCSQDIKHLNDVLGELRPSITDIDRYFSVVWFLVGLPGNFLSFFVWIRQQMRPSSGCYLAALALNDFIFLLLFFLSELNTAWEKWVLNYPVICEMFPTIYYTFQYLSPFLILAFTVERYISICHPYQRDKYCTVKRNLVVIACLVLYTLLINSFQIYNWHFDANSSTCTYRKSVSQRVRNVFMYVTEIQAFAIVPLVITVLNIRVIVEIHRINKRASKQQSYQTPNNPSNSATTATLLLVSFYYIVSTLPVTICYIMVPTQNICLPLRSIPTDPEWQYILNFWNARVVIQELGASHYACNIIFYLLTGSQFRLESKALLNKVCQCGKMEKVQSMKRRLTAFCGCCTSGNGNSDVHASVKVLRISNGENMSNEKRWRENNSNEGVKYNWVDKSDVIRQDMLPELNKSAVTCKRNADNDLKDHYDIVQNPLLKD